MMYNLKNQIHQVLKELKERRGKKKGKEGKWIKISKRKQWMLLPIL